MSILGLSIGIALLIILNSLSMAYRQAAHVPLKEIGADITVQRSGDVPNELTGSVFPCSAVTIHKEEVEKIGKLPGVRGMGTAVLLWVFDPNRAWIVLGIEKENFIGPLGFFVIKNPADYTYGIVFSLKDASNKIDKNELEKNNNVVFLDNYVVLTTKTDMIEDLKEIGKGNEKSLVLNPVYASAKSILPKQGKLFILPLTKNGNGFLYQLLDKKVTDQMFSIINSFLDSKLDYAVVI